MTGDQIKLNLNIHPRGLWDFLDCLLCMGFLERTGTGETSIYSNSAEADKYLNKKVHSMLVAYWNLQTLV